MNPSNPKIDAAATECLKQCNVSRLPWQTAYQFIDTLQKSKDWTGDEIIEVMRKVIALLLQERSGSGTQ